MVEQSYRYLVVSRKNKRYFNEDDATIVKDIPGQTVKVQRIVNEETGEVELYCHSLLREKKEQAMQDQSAEHLEKALQNLSDGLQKKGTTKRYDKVQQRIGRLKEKYARAAQHYVIDVTRDSESDQVTAINWMRQEKAHSQAMHPGVYCLRTKEIYDALNISAQPGAIQKTRV